MQTTLRRIRLAEALEDVGHRLGVDPLPGIADPDLGVETRLPELDRDRSSSRGELDRIRQQVPEHLLESSRVAEHDGEAHFAADPQVFLRGERQDGIDGRIDHAGERDLGRFQAQLPGVEPLHVHQVLDQLGLRSALAIDDGQALPDALGAHAGPLEQGHPPANGIQRAAQLVGQDGEEVALGSIGLRQLRDPTLQLGLQALALGDVASHLGCADDHARRIADRRDRERDGHERSILALPHRFVVLDRLAPLDAPEDLRLLVDVVLRDQHGHRVADGLFRGVAEQALRPAIPAGDDTGEVLRDDRVLGIGDDGREPRQRLIALLALDQVRRLTRQDVEQAQVAIGRPMRSLPVRGEYAHQGAVARPQRGRLDRPDAGPAEILEGWRSGDEVPALDIVHDHALASAAGCAARGPGVRTNELEHPAEFRFESAERQQSQGVLVAVDHLHAGHVRAHDRHGRFHDPLVQGLDALLLDDLGAQALQELGVGQLRLQLGARVAQRLLGPLALGDVDEHVDAADDLARLVEQRCGIGREPDAHAVGALGDGFGSLDDAALLQGDRHGALVVRHGTAVGVVELPGHAPVVAAELGSAAGEGHAGGIEMGQPARGVRRVDRGGQRVQHLAKAPLALERPLRGDLGSASAAGCVVGELG